MKGERAYREEIKTASFLLHDENGTTVVLYRVSNIVLQQQLHFINLGSHAFTHARTHIPGDVVSRALWAVCGLFSQWGGQDHPKPYVLNSTRRSLTDRLV